MSEEKSTKASTADSHKNESFLKSAWHKLTHQNETNRSERQVIDHKPGEKTEDEPKKAASSG